MLQIFTLRGKTKVLYYSLLREKKVSYYITFFQEEQYIPFNEQQKCHVTNLYTVKEKQKYHITFFSEENESITFFLRPLLC